MYPYKKNNSTYFLYDDGYFKNKYWEVKVKIIVGVLYNRKWKYYRKWFDQEFVVVDTKIKDFKFYTWCVSHIYPTVLNMSKRYVYKINMITKIFWWAPTQVDA